MRVAPLRLGFIPLLDAAPLIVAREIGFDEEEGLRFILEKAPSWSTLRDWVAIGQIDAAHMLSPVPVAAALGLGGVAVRLNALSVLSVNGNVIGVSKDIAARMRAGGHTFAFDDPEAAGHALMAASAGPLRIGVPFPFSMHAELLFYWLGTLGVPAPQGLDVRTIPPPLMADAIAAGEIDAFCVGEPWGSLAVETGVGALLLPGRAIWQAAPEKVLAVRESWAVDRRDIADRMIRALWRAGRWLGQTQNHGTASEILSRGAYLNISAELLDRALSGNFVVTPHGEQRSSTDFVAFHSGAVGFPWRSQAAWIADRLVGRTGLDRDGIRDAAQVFRSDIYREALGPLHVDLPGASEKIEGAIRVPTEVASANGTLILSPDRFFDGRVFEPLRED